MRKGEGKDEAYSADLGRSSVYMGKRQGFIFLRFERLGEYAGFDR